MLEIGATSPTLAAVSAFSLRLIPTWLGIQQNVIDLPLFISWLWSFSILEIRSGLARRKSKLQELMDRSYESRHTLRPILYVL